MLNIDETPLQGSEAPVTAWVHKGSKQAAEISVRHTHKSYLTLFPTITADGKTLRLCAILKGKTDRCFKSVRKGASSAVNRVKLYHTERGKMNTVTMLAWLQDVVLSYTEGRPAALILDSYGSHWSTDVIDLATHLHIQLIQVPPKLTATLQPLDVSFNGPFLSIRRRIWLEQRVANPWKKDNWQSSIERSQLAYEEISEAITKHTWQAASLIE